MKPTVWIYAPTGDLCVHTPCPRLFGERYKGERFVGTFEHEGGTLAFYSLPKDGETFIYLGEL